MGVRTGRRGAVGRPAKDPTHGPDMTRHRAAGGWRRGRHGRLDETVGFLRRRRRKPAGAGCQHPGAPYGGSDAAPAGGPHLVVKT